MKFEEELKRLEEIVKQLENEETSLDDSISLFEEGTKILKKLREKLNEAEKKVKILLKDPKGEFHLEEEGNETP